MSHLIGIYTVCKFSYTFQLWYIKSFKKGLNQVLLTLVRPNCDISKNHLQLTFSDPNTAVSNSFLSPLEKIPLLQIRDNLG